MPSVGALLSAALRHFPATGRVSFRAAGVVALHLSVGQLLSAQGQTVLAGAPATRDRLATVNVSSLVRRQVSPSTAPAPRRFIPAPMPHPGWLEEPVASNHPTPRRSGLQFGNAASGGTFTPELSTNFLAVLDNQTSDPPDTQGAVGPNHLMVTLNSEVAMQSRQGQYVSRMSLRAFWGNLGNSSLYDPRVVYDPLVDRWATVVLADPHTTNSAVLIGASTSADPTGVWNLSAIPVNPGPGLTNQVWADYPNLGFNGRWVTVSVNLYTVSSNTFVRADLFVFDQQKLFTGTFSYARLNDPNFFTLVPATTFDPGETNLYLVTEYGTRNLRISRITGTVGQERYDTNGIVTASVDAWNFSPGSTNFLPQLQTDVRILANDSRVQNVVFRNGSLWCAQTVFLPPGTNVTHSAVQWWQLATNAAVLQRGRIEDTNAVMDYAFPSIAVNRNNDALIGYSSFSPDQYASAGYSYRLGSDPTNSVRAGAVLKAGLAPFRGHTPATNQTATTGLQPAADPDDPQSGDLNRWGDFSATLVDPLNDTDLWTIQEYAELPDSTGDRWGTWWGYLRFQPSTPPNNDTFANSLPLTGASAVTHGSNAEASLEPGEPQHAHESGGRSVWWTWTAPKSGLVTITTEGSNFDTLLAVYTGASVSNLTEVASDDDSGTNLASRVTFTATKGTSYQIAVDGYTGFAGNIQLGLTMAPPDFPPTLAMTSPTNGTAVVQTTTVTLVASAADADGSVTRVEFVNGKTTLGVVTNAPYTLLWTNAAVGSHLLYARAWDDQGLGASSSPISLLVVPTNFPPVATFVTPTNGAIFSAPAAVNVEVDATDADGSITNVKLLANGVALAEANGAPALFSLTVPSPGRYTLSATATDDQGATSGPVTAAFIVRPANDSFTNAVPLNGSTVATNGSNLEATHEPGEPSHAGNAGGQSVWWSWTAPTNGIVTVSTEGSTFDTTLGVYTGDAVTNLSLVTSNDDRSAADFTSLVTFAAVHGTVYQIAVDGFLGTNGVMASGNISLSLAFVASNLPPTVTLALATNEIVLGTNQTVFAAPANLLLQAVVTGVDAPIARVGFYVAGTNQLQEVTTSPYSFLWTNVGAGTYTLTARATDALGLTNTSSAVTITVTPRPGRLTARGLATHPPFGLTLLGEPAFHYGIEASTNLATWTTLTNLLVNPDGTVGFVDPASTNVRSRFYRAVLGP